MKERLDVLLCLRKLVKSRENAKALIMEGKVFVNNQKSDKAGEKFDIESEIFIKTKPNIYVSRGGLKLEKALKIFKINLLDKIAVDIGASTGGFTDCMLKNGCKKVYCVDVGYGQLDWNLRRDSRVIVLERTNIRYIDKKLINDPIDFFTVDVSFISLCLVLPVIKDIIMQNATGVCLIKPQFEAQRKDVGKKGIIKESSVRIKVMEKIINFCAEIGFSVLNLDFSPIKGQKGNIEYLILIQKSAKPEINLDIDLKDIEEKANIKFNSLESSFK